MVHLITGVSGFIGSQLAESLIDSGEQVRGIDCFTPYYDRSVKEANLARLFDEKLFEFHDIDLRTAALAELLGDVRVIYHQAGQPGVRLSWSTGFSTYNDCNVLATQRLLEAARVATIDRFVFASSSSVYGNAGRYPVLETDLPKPHSPYGVTKLAAEHLCGLYAANYGVPAVSLRYFTVFGPRQRPDMAHHRLVEAALNQTPFPLFGDGSAVRDFTFVADVVDANILAGTADVPPGTVVNVCGGGSTSMVELIDAVGAAVGSPVPIAAQAPQRGDVDRTGGSNALAASLLGWSAKTSLHDGIRTQVDWHLEQRR